MFFFLFLILNANLYITIYVDFLLVIKTLSYSTVGNASNHILCKICKNISELNIEE